MLPLCHRIVSTAVFTAGCCATIVATYLVVDCCVNGSIFFTSRTMRACLSFTLTSMHSSVRTSTRLSFHAFGPLQRTAAFRKFPSRRRFFATIWFLHNERRTPNADRRTPNEQQHYVERRQHDNTTTRQHDNTTTRQHGGGACHASARTTITRLPTDTDR